MTPTAADETLRDEIRLLGAMLGEVIKGEGGQALYDRIEAVRQASVAYHRDDDGDAEALEALLKDIDLDQAVGLAHGFAAFSLLANIAEDRAGKRRALDQAEAAARPDTPAGALKRLSDQGVGVDEIRESAVPGPDLAGPDRPPVRGAPQERHRPHRRGQRPAGRLRQGRPGLRHRAAQRGPAPPDRHPVGHPSGAPEPALWCRTRSTPWSPSWSACSSTWRPSGCTPGATCWRRPDLKPFLQHRQLGRRRPRRQSQRQRRGAQRRLPHPVPRRAAPTTGSGARPGRRAQPVRRPGPHQPGDEGPGRGVRRHLRPPRRRALSPGAQPHLRPAVGHLSAADRRSGAPPRPVRGAAL